MSKPIISEKHNGTEHIDDCLFENSIAFSQFIERKSVHDKVPCLDIIIDLCELRDIDVEDITKLLTQPIKDKLKKEMIDRGMVKRTEATLDDI